MYFTNFTGGTSFRLVPTNLDRNANTLREHIATRVSGENLERGKEIVK